MADKNLDMLLNRTVQISRATWFLRAVAGAEIVRILHSFFA